MIAKLPFPGLGWSVGREEDPRSGSWAEGLGPVVPVPLSSCLARGPWELTLPNEVSLREHFHLVTKGCPGSSDLTLGLNPMPSLALGSVIPGMCWARWPEKNVEEIQPFQAEKAAPRCFMLGLLD